MKYLSAFLLSLCATSALAADRVALVIGNGNYATPLQKLEACPRDAAKMAAAFEKIGIRVYGGKPQINLNADEMDTALNDFARSLDKDSEAFIYYSGHGAQIGGANYLLPIGFNARFESQARRQAVSLDTILELLEKTSSKLRVVILDSCRDAGEFLPGEPTLKGPNRAKGLTEQKVDAPETLVCFATKHGTAALADDTSSYYTRVLSEEIVKPGKVEDVMKIVARRVYAETDSKQLPFTYGSLLQDHFFVPGNAVPLPTAAASTPVNPIATAPAAAAIPPPAVGEDASRVAKTADASKDNSHPPPPEVVEQMKRDFVKVYANLPKYVGKEVVLDVYVITSMNVLGKVYAYLCPSYPNSDGSILYGDLSKLPDGKKELALSSSGQVLTFTGKIGKAQALGLILYPTDVRPTDPSKWTKP